MDRQRFAALVARLEVQAARDPSAYRVRVVLLALLGYAFLFAILGALLVIATGMVWLIITGAAIALLLKLLIPIALLARAIVRALYVRFQPPGGVPLDRGSAPRLFALLDDLCARLETPRFDHVLMDTQFNAGVTEVPRLGIFGWPRHYLVLGLPLTAAVTTTQLCAILAHELGHRSGRHGRVGGWIYRLRVTWSQLFERLAAERRTGTWIFSRFFAWYAPLFEAWSFVLARQQEYEADRLAAELTSARHLFDALVAIEVRARYFQQDLWGGVEKLARAQPEPPAALFAQFTAALAAPLAPAQLTTYLRGALDRPTTELDTHPALSDRLKALGMALPATDASLPPPAPSAAEELLGPAVEELSRTFDAQWRAAVEPGWRDAYRNAAKSRRRLEDLAARASTLNVGELRERALLTGDLDGANAALPLLRAAAAAAPGDAELRFVLGRAMLSAGDTAGVAELEAAMGRDPLLVVPGCQLLAGWCQERGDPAARDAWIERGQAQQDLLVRADAERHGVGQHDGLEPHGVPEAELAALKEQLRMYDDIRRAWLLRKTVVLFPEVPYYVLVADVGHAWWKFQRRSTTQTLVTRLAAEARLPGAGYIVVIGAQFEWLGKRARAMGADALIYEAR